MIDGDKSAVIDIVDIAMKVSNRSKWRRGAHKY